MQFGVYRYTFDDPIENLNLKQLGDKAPSATWDFDEWLCLRYHNGCELFVTAGNTYSEGDIRSFLIHQKYLPEENILKKEIQIGREAVSRFLQIAVGATGSKNGKQLLEILQKTYIHAGECGQIGQTFHRLFQRGIWLHEKARQETNFFKFAVSPETVTIELIGKIRKSFTQSNIHIIGNHQIVRPMLKELHQAGCRKFTFMGKPAGIDEMLVHELGGIIESENIREIPEKADIVIACPSASNFLSEQIIRKRIKRRSKTPLLIFDYFASDLDHKSLKKINNLYIYSEKDIEKAIEYNMEKRRESVKEMDIWIQAEIDSFYEWQNSEDRYQFAGIIGATPQMQRIFEMISRIARTDITVLIDGESGTGKEMIANAIHSLSNRADKPLQVINCGAIPENLLESELFGHERGAFTGAVAQKKGLFQTADKGTVFLDEIAELPAQLQVKLLRFLQEGEIKSVGSNQTLRVDVRVLAASNKNLAKMVEEGTFRSDLFYRLNVIQMTIPPLRERTADISLLCKFFIQKYTEKLRKKIIDITPEALQALTEYTWPGNIRELENTIERSVALAFGKSITIVDLPPILKESTKALKVNPSPDYAGRRLTLKELEKNYILETLEACSWNYDQVCKELGIGRTTLWRKLKEYDLEN